MADTREHQMGEAIRWTGGVVLLGSLLAAAPLAAAQIGTGRQMVDVNGTPLVAFTYRPAACSDPSLPMVFHGIARNARSYPDDARPRAAPRCLLAAAPGFAQQAFPTWPHPRGG